MDAEVWYHEVSTSPHELWEAFTVSAGKIIRDSFTKTHLTPLCPPNMITNTQACVATVQTYSNGINKIAEDTLAPIQFQVTRTNNTMVIIQAKVSIQKPLRNIILREAAYDTLRKRTVPPLQEMRRETMMILKKRKVKLANEDANTRRKPN